MDSSSVRAGVGVFGVKVEHFEFEPAYSIGSKRSFFPRLEKIADLVPSDESSEEASESVYREQDHVTKTTALEPKRRVPGEMNEGRSRGRLSNSQPLNGVTKQAQQLQPVRKKVAVSRGDQATAPPRKKRIAIRAQESPPESFANKETLEVPQESAPDHSAPPLSRRKRNRAEASPRLGFERKAPTEIRPCRDSQQVRAVERFVVETERRPYPESQQVNDIILQDHADSADGSQSIRRRRALNFKSGERSPDARPGDQPARPKEKGSLQEEKEAERGVTYEPQGKPKIELGDSVKDNDESMETISVNARGEPEGSYVHLVIEKIRRLVEKLIPVRKKWGVVSPEAKYGVCQELQQMFTNGHKVDSTWIRNEAKKAHSNAQKRAQAAFWRAECERADD